jgi:hypothetical protein
MIEPICNQPINFCDPLIFGAGCNDMDIPLQIATEDELVFQILQDHCADAETFVAEPQFRSGWGSSSGWTVDIGNACGRTSQGGQNLVYSAWAPTPGQFYQVEVNVTSITGTVTVNLAGVDHVLTSPGVQSWVVIAETVDFLRFTLDDNFSSICLASAQVYEANTSLTVELVDNTGVVLYDSTVVAFPQHYTYTGSHVIVRIPMAETGVEDALFQVRVVDGCDEVTLTSQTWLRVKEHCDEGLKLRVCLDNFDMGFAPGFLECRVPASVQRPRWSVDAVDNRSSNGVMRRTYADRTVALELHIQIVDDALHPFLSCISMFDHFYVNELEFVVEAGAYEPAYGEQLGNGAALLSITPKAGLLRRVACNTEGPGCNPANDPICTTPNATVGATEIGGKWYVFVSVFSELGFVPVSIEWSLNNNEQTPIPWTGQGTELFGPLRPEDVVVITLTNADPACNYTFPSVVVDRPEEYFMFRVLEDDSLGDLTVILDAPDYYTLRFEDGSYQVVGNGDSLQLPASGDYFAYASDADGNPVAGGITEIQFFNIPILPIDFSALPALLGIVMGDCSLTEPPLLTSSTLLEVMQYDDNSLTELPPLSLHPALRELFLTNNSFTVLPDFTSNPALSDAVFAGNAIAASDAIDNFFVVMEAKGLSNGTAQTSGGTNAAPTAASLTARNALLFRGYNVLFN